MNWQRAVDTYRGHTVPHLRLVEHRNWWFIGSGVVIALSLVGLVFVRLNYSIDFTGGAKLTFPLRTDATVADFQAILTSSGLAEPEVQIATGPDGTSVSIRTEALDTAPNLAAPSSSGTATASATASASPTATASGSVSASATASASASETTGPAQGTTSALLLNALAKEAGVAYNEINVESIGPTWGTEISSKALRGLLLVLLAIALYIAMRFEWKMAVGAMIALVHDIVITAGVYALIGREVTPETVIAILTILGFSLYDTVVIYDKIKENTESTALIARHGYSGVVNLSLNQTLMRSVNTSLVVLVPILSLMLFGGATLKDFAIAMFIGVATGAYSSIFIAAPVLTVLKGREKRYRQIEARVAAKQAVPGARAAVVATSDVAASGATARTSPARPRPKSNKRPRAKRKRR